MYQTYNNDQWLHIIDEHNNGLTTDKIIEKYNIAKSTFYKKKRLLLRSGESNITFKEVKVDQPINESIKIIKKGFEIEFNDNTDINLFKKLMDVMYDI